MDKEQNIYTCLNCAYAGTKICQGCIATDDPSEKPTRWMPRKMTDDYKLSTKMKDPHNGETDMVSHPAHYKSEMGLEVIDVIEAFTYGLDGMEAVDTGNILKYICRWKKKNGIEDLKKAKWYLEHLIKHLEAKEYE